MSDTSAAPATSRVTGLRLGLGRGVAVAVVARYGGAVRVIGAQPVLRTAFVDGALARRTATCPGRPECRALLVAGPRRPGTVLRRRRRRHRRQPVGTIHAVHHTGARARLTVCRVARGQSRRLHHDDSTRIAEHPRDRPGGLATPNPAPATGGGTADATVVVLTAVQGLFTALESVPALQPAIGQLATGINGGLSGAADALDGGPANPSGGIAGQLKQLAGPSGGH